MCEPPLKVKISDLSPDHENVHWLVHTEKTSLGVHNILVRKTWFYPPPQKGCKMRKTCTNQYKIPQSELISKSFRGGGTRFYGQNDFMDICQKTVPGRVRVKFAHEKATKKPRKSNEKGPNTVFLARRGPRKSHEKTTTKPWSAANGGLRDGGKSEKI